MIVILSADINKYVLLIVVDGKLFPLVFIGPSRLL